MHDSVMTYVAWVVDNYRLKGPAVLEVGSYDVNGTVRPLFKDAHYTGVDMRPGPGVDLIAPAAFLPYLAPCFDIVVSTEMLEHDTRPWRSVAEMARVLVSGGHMILTARGFDARGCFPLHSYPDDHWRMSVGALRALFEDARLQVIDVRADPETPGVFGLAKKP